MKKEWTHQLNLTILTFFYTCKQQTACRDNLKLLLASIPILHSPRNTRNSAKYCVFVSNMIFTSYCTVYAIYCLHSTVEMSHRGLPQGLSSKMYLQCRRSDLIDPGRDSWRKWQPLQYFCFLEIRLTEANGLYSPHELRKRDLTL